jgi:hypothetical protein
LLTEDRVVTTDLLRQQAELSVGDRSVWLPEGLFDMLEDTGFHVVLPAGRVMGPDVDKMFIELVIGTEAGPTRVEAMAEDDWFDGLPTAHAVLTHFCGLLPDVAQTLIDDISDPCDG